MQFFLILITGTFCKSATKTTQTDENAHRSFFSISRGLLFEALQPRRHSCLVCLLNSPCCPSHEREREAIYQERTEVWFVYPNITRYRSSISRSSQTLKEKRREFDLIKCRIFAPWKDWQGCVLGITWKKLFGIWRVYSMQLWSSISSQFSRFQNTLLSDVCCWAPAPCFLK